MIELLVVIAIIGLLSSVILGSLNTARKKGRDARRLADVKQLQVALELYYSNQTTPAYPTLATFNDGSALTPTYISVMPKDPSSNANYNYVASASGNFYCIGAVTEASIPTPADSCDGAALGATEPTGSFRVGP